MPPKRCNIGRRTRTAASMAALRSVENEENRALRLERCREDRSRSRSARTEEERKAKNTDDRLRMRRNRAIQGESIENRRLIQIQHNSNQRTHRLSRPLCRAAFEYDSSIDYSSNKFVVIGTMNKVCQYCKALKFSTETPGMCCAAGKVFLPELNAPPEPLLTLLSRKTQASIHFLNNIRKYNTCFQMTSFGATNIIRDNYMPTFKIQGQIYHRAGSILPLPDKDHKFSGGIVNARN